MHDLSTFKQVTTRRWLLTLAYTCLWLLKQISTNKMKNHISAYSCLHNCLQQHFEKCCLYLASDVTAENAEVTLAFICQQGSNGDHRQKTCFSL